MADQAREYALSSLTNAIRLLNLFGKERPELTLRDIAAELGVAKSTAHRLLATLYRGGLVERSPDGGRYRLGLRLYELGMLAVQHLELREQALMHLDDLRNTTGETAHLAVRDGAEVVYIERRESHHSLRLFSHIGHRMPVHSTSTGKAILAFEPAEVVEAILAAGLPRLTANTIVDADRFRRELEGVRRAGYALNVEESEPHASSVAAPIRDYTGQVIAAVSVAGPSQRLTPAALKSVAKLVRSCADTISARMGYAPSQQG
jgi:IclR family KDG regulon transcriptional repressor